MTVTFWPAPPHCSALTAVPSEISLHPEDQRSETDPDGKADHAQDRSPEVFAAWIEKVLIHGTTLMVGSVSAGGAGKGKRRNTLWCSVESEAS